MTVLLGLAQYQMVETLLTGRRVVHGSFWTEGKQDDEYMGIIRVAANVYAVMYVDYKGQMTLSATLPAMGSNCIHWRRYG